MDKVTQDFSFNKFSPIYGEFLLEMYNSDPEAVITDVSMRYPFAPNKPLYASVTVSENLAVVLKLRFGAHLRTRPTVVDDKMYDTLKEYSKLIKFKRFPNWDDTDKILNFEILKNRNSKEGYFIDLETYKDKIK